MSDKIVSFPTKKNDAGSRSPSSRVDDWLAQRSGSSFVGPPLLVRRADRSMPATPDWCKSHVSLPLQNGGVCNLFRGKKTRLAEESSGGDDVYIRELYGEVIQDGAPTGSLTLVEWHLPLFTTNWELCRQADEHSDEAVCAAQVVATNWCVEDLASAGGFLEFSGLRMVPGSPPAIWNQALDRILNSRSKHRPAILVLKAHPLPFINACELSWTGPATAGVDHADQLKRMHEMFVRRQAAMMRHYASTMGVKPLPGEQGEDGWMWKPLLESPETDFEPSVSYRHVDLWGE